MVNDNMLFLQILKNNFRNYPLAIMYYVRYPISFRQVEDVLNEWGIDISNERFDFGWTFGSKFTREIGENKARHHSNW